MANRTVKDANSIHGTNPQYLVEKIIRTRIYESKYWKEECFGLTGDKEAESLMLMGLARGGITERLLQDLLVFLENINNINY